jgi:hypothetical protein
VVRTRHVSHEVRWTQGACCQAMNGFISYAHDDYKIFRTFHPHLRAVERELDVRFWSDHRINAGYNWGTMIRQAIETAEVFILLVSPSFIGSDYIYDYEIPAIRERKKSPRTLVLPVILSRCSWQWLCGALQALPTVDGRLKPIADWQPHRNGLDHARQQIASSLQNYYGITPSTLDWSVP